MQYKCECVGAINYSVALEKDRHREKQRKLKKYTNSTHSGIRLCVLIIHLYAHIMQCSMNVYSLFIWRALSSSSRPYNIFYFPSALLAHWVNYITFSFSYVDLSYFIINVCDIFCVVIFKTEF